VIIDLANQSCQETIDIEPTASMSWDNLTPDPSPLYQQEHQILPHLFSPNENSSATSGEHTKLWDDSGEKNTFEMSSFSNTLERHYDLKPFPDLQLNCSTRKAANLNPAIEMEINSIETTKDCTSMENTGKRLDIPLKRTNIVDKIKELESK